MNQKIHKATAALVTNGLCCADKLSTNISILTAHSTIQKNIIG
jgi:hypothetical protein